MNNFFNHKYTLLGEIMNYLKSFLCFFIYMFIYLIFISIFYYFEVFNNFTLSIINYICVLALFFYLGFNISKKIKFKGYLNGFVVSLVVVLLFSTFTLIFDEFCFSTLVYYLSLMVSSIIGGIVGVK